MAKTKIKRVFHIEKGKNSITLPDPDDTMSPEQVLAFYMNQYPELVSATVSTPEYDDDKAVYSFKTVTGTKG